MASTSQQPQSYWKIINQLSVISYQGIGSRGATTNYQLPITNDKQSTAKIECSSVLAGIGGRSIGLNLKPLLPLVL
ncbi:hypothetical protein C7Y66_12270 [Chroococcidiopsis sp. CCALA 051]|uniref:hypothetical protein n=1 Tax=Chroococcidiopsis sp. CCALA 051 TaxID=869949 RepID=UPI000D0CB7C3|nr:hypothetical protein [Chroococcidiopsis sp. CCALA 051]MBE9016418.1 hypothetical protein [Chroococcidiopsidales cyanobacterium LEGE 13417]PSM48859.1 hypothetical protein C7Y66_12270 [Chroococcidiopsis sp. CCALA 051]